MTIGQNKTIFSHYRKSLAVAGLTTSSADSLICPLCWQETPFDSLSLEHIIPSSVGGTRKILTCRRCNNEHGSTLDSHLSQYQAVKDAFNGYGTLSTKLNVNGKEVIANLEWTAGSKNFKIVGKASNPAASGGIQEDFKAGEVSSVKCNVAFGYSKNNFQTAILRAAYLVLFKRFGYEYVKHEIVQAIRRRICDPLLDHPRLSSLILEIREFQPPGDESYFIVPGDVNGVEFFLVIIRVRKATTTYLGAYLPKPGDRCDDFFDLMEQCSREYNGKAFTIPTEGMFT